MEDKSINKIKIIDAVKTPLAFCTLALLVGEGILAYLGSKAHGTDFTIFLISMILFMFFLVIIIVKYLTGDIFDMEVEFVFNENEKPEDIRNAVAYYQINDEPFNKKNKLIVHHETSRDFVSLPRVRIRDRITVGLDYNKNWYETPHLIVTYRRAEFKLATRPVALKQ